MRLVLVSYGETSLVVWAGKGRLNGNASSPYAQKRADIFEIKLYFVCGRGANAQTTGIFGPRRLLQVFWTSLSFLTRENFWCSQISMLSVVGQGFLDCWATVAKSFGLRWPTWEPNRPICYLGRCPKVAKLCFACLKESTLKTNRFNFCLGGLEQAQL